ncbi:MAG: MarR family transcriptional regulator [Zavarzinella sp.]
MNNHDVIDRMMLRWGEILPELDGDAMHLVGRIIILAQHLERSVESALSLHGMTLGQFDILATLRRAGPQSPKQLMQNVMLTSGGMTNRLDRLQHAGWVERTQDPNDRRALIVRLTAAGQELIDVATKTRFADAENSLPAWDPATKTSLAEMLRQWLSHLEAQGKAEKS